MQLHTARNLIRLGQRALAERILSGNPDADRAPIRVLTWQCLQPGMERLRFIGRRVSPSSGMQCHDLLALLESIVFAPVPFRWRVESDWWRWLLSALQDWRHRAFFDGVLIDAVKLSLHGRPVPSLLEEDGLPLPEGLSLLTDGSLIAPADLMQVYDVVNI